MSKVATIINPDSVVIIDNEFIGAEKTYVFPIEIIDNYIVYVWVHDNTKYGINEDAAREIANKAVEQRIWWSNERMCYWMHDFECGGHWAEALFPNNGLPEDDATLDELLRINVYE